MTNETNSLDLVPVTFAAGESRLFQMSGNYFELIDCPTPVDVVLSDLNGAQRCRMKQAEASFYSKDVDFSTIQITSAGAQTIRFAYGTGEAGTRRSTGSVVISGAVALDAPTLAALEYVQVRPEPKSAHFSDASALTANTPLTIFTPGSNVNGAILLSADCCYYSGTGGMTQAFISKASAPATVVDGEIFLLGRNLSYQSTGTVWVGGGSLSKEQYVPAGQGLYYISNVSTGADLYNTRACRYKLL